MNSIFDYVPFCFDELINGPQNKYEIIFLFLVKEKNMDMMNNIINYCNNDLITNSINFFISDDDKNSFDFLIENYSSHININKIIIEATNKYPKNEYYFDYIINNFNMEILNDIDNIFKKICGINYKCAKVLIELFNVDYTKFYDRIVTSPSSIKYFMELSDYNFINHITHDHIYKMIVNYKPDEIMLDILRMVYENRNTFFDNIDPNCLEIIFFNKILFNNFYNIDKKFFKNINIDILIEEHLFAYHVGQLEYYIENIPSISNSPQKYFDICCNHYCRREIIEFWLDNFDNIGIGENILNRFNRKNYREFFKKYMARMDNDMKEIIEIIDVYESNHNIKLSSDILKNLVMIFKQITNR